MEECEVKFLDVDPKALEAKILKLGGRKHYDRIFKRIIFDYPDLRLNKAGAWLRVRDEGDKVTMAFKQRVGMRDDGSNDQSTLEEEVVVSDFETTAAILRRVGLTDKFYEENRRIHFELDGVMLDIDHWPMIPPYLEIEAESYTVVERMIKKLGLNPADKKLYPTWQVYKDYGINEGDYQIITFEKQVKKTTT